MTLTFLKLHVWKFVIRDDLTDSLQTDDKLAVSEYIWKADAEYLERGSLANLTGNLTAVIRTSAAYLC